VNVRIRFQLSAERYNILLLFMKLAPMQERATLQIFGASAGFGITSHSAWSDAQTPSLLFGHHLGNTL
jgi:hypothetical protein